MKLRAPALLIIDMQKGMASAFAGTRNNPDAEANIALLLALWRQLKLPVVHIRHISRNESSPFAPGRPGVTFQTEFMPLDNEAVFEKNVPCAFAHSGLERWLYVRGVQELIITGVSTNNSVEASARTAGNLGFAVSVVADACFAFAKTDYAGKERSADDVHDMALANLDGEYARIIRAQDVLQDLERRDNA